MNFGRILVDHLPPGLPMPILSGVLRGAWWRHVRGQDQYWRGCYEPDMQRALAEVLAPGQWFFDIGAHHGFFSLLALRRGAQVMAWDIDPAARAEFRRNTGMECRPVDARRERWTDLPAPDVVKLDVDGAEVEVLRRLLLARPPRVLLVECHSYTLERECWSLLSGWQRHLTESSTNHHPRLFAIRRSP